MSAASFDAAESDALHERVQAFVREPGREPFDGLALDLARWQARAVATIGRLARGRGVDLDAATSASAIPALPTDVLRHARVAAHPTELDARVFETSGTTHGARGAHAMRRTDTYASAALASGRAMLLAPIEARRPIRAISLVPAAAAAPESSLSFMVDLFAREVGEASWHVEGAAIDVRRIVAACATARRAGEAVVVMGTSFAFVHLLDALGAGDATLPLGSRVMHTGGFKGRSREVSPAELRASLARVFAVSERAVVCEYGMTELSSQLWEPTIADPAAAVGGPYVAPPWVRVDAVDPATLAPLASGEVGIARMVDLANVDSSVAIQTADLVRVDGDRVTLLGRMPGATPRGCSLAMDELLGGAR